MTNDYGVQLRRLEDGSLQPNEFSHLDHIGVAYQALMQHEFFEAVRIVADGIRGMAARANAPEKFNATITLAFMSLIAERMKTTCHQDADDFIRRNTDLVDRFSLSRWYSRERLTSELACSIALLPDAALPAALPSLSPEATR
jgi:hypothetical protein